MTATELKQQPSLYLQVSFQDDQPYLPLHTSIALFLLSYCECKSFKVFLVFPKEGGSQALKSHVPAALNVFDIHLEDLPRLVGACRLPAVLDGPGRLVRAGLAVVLRHILTTTLEADPSRKDVLALLGFKKTCLKACAEVSKWTRLCEIDIPSAVEEHLKMPAGLQTQPPPSILTLERRLGEPVKVHNDDKIRRQKLKEQQQLSEKGSDSDPSPLELRAALAKMSVESVPTLTTRENSEIRKVRTTELPPLEHLFAEGLYFTLTDVVLLPCIHRYLVRLLREASSSLRLPHLLRWYANVQEVPGVVRAAEACGMAFSTPLACLTGPPVSPTEDNPASRLEEDEGQETVTQPPFVGGPRPTMTKLKENCIEAVFAPHPRPGWTLPWDSLPEAINPTEAPLCRGLRPPTDRKTVLTHAGKMSDVRAVRKRQQLNNMVVMVTELARPGYTVVDFCSGTGHVGIVLAHTLPDCQVILIENKEESLLRAQSRSSELGLKNIAFIQANLDYFTGPFHIGNVHYTGVLFVQQIMLPLQLSAFAHNHTQVALHACGIATDMVMEHCVQAGAAFVISPCCYGFIQNAVKFTFPRSKKFQESLTYKEHMVLCRFADQTAVQLPPERRLIGKQCMGLVDLDRSWGAETRGYTVQVMTMEPESCSPKNNMLVGRP
ncbi:unnamed protein product, partial [Tetraodon nigroviridis]